MVTATRVQRNQYQLEQSVGRALYKVSFAKGPKGRGKSTFLVGMAYQLREIYGKKPLIIGTSLGLNPETFGPYNFLSIDDFLEELKFFEKLAAEEGKRGATEKTATSQEVRKKLEAIGLINGTLVGDEMYRIMEARLSGSANKTILTLGYFFSVIRHYRDTALIASPSQRMVDMRLRDQIDYEVSVGNDCDTHFDRDGNPYCARPGCLHIVTSTFRTPRELPFRIRWIAPKYWAMYNSWSAASVASVVKEKKKKNEEEGEEE